MLSRVYWHCVHTPHGKIGGRLLILPHSYIKVKSLARLVETFPLCVCVCVCMPMFYGWIMNSPHSPHRNSVCVCVCVCVCVSIHDCYIYSMQLLKSSTANMYFSMVKSHVGVLLWKGLAGNGGLVM